MYPSFPRRVLHYFFHKGATPSREDRAIQVLPTANQCFVPHEKTEHIAAVSLTTEFRVGNIPAAAFYFMEVGKKFKLWLLQDTIRIDD